jgi:hypothetical protein
MVPPADLVAVVTLLHPQGPWTTVALEAVGAVHFWIADPNLNWTAYAPDFQVRPW